MTARYTLTAHCKNASHLATFSLRVSGWRPAARQAKSGGVSLHFRQETNHIGNQPLSLHLSTFFLEVIDIYHW
jgi:hypothetical protein